MVIPALGLAEQDRHRNELDEETQNFIYQSTREIIEDLPIAAAENHGEGTVEGSSGLSPDGVRATGLADVVCIPDRDQADDVVNILLARLLERQRKMN